MSALRFWDPAGVKYGLPTYPWRLAPEGLATRRQLAAEGLRPGGQDPVAQVLWRRGNRVAFLYRIDLAAPKRPMTPAKVRALGAAMAARRWCPGGSQSAGHDAGYVIPTSLGACVQHAGL